jgi:uncharacterized glyoxalase superfamily protein PhnB
MQIPAQYNQLMPYLILSTASEFLEFAKTVFGATEQLMQHRPDGSVMHAELRIGQAVIMFADANETVSVRTAGMCLLVEDVDGVYAKAVSQGATTLQAPEDKDYGKQGGFQDKFGNQWWLIESIK